MENIHKMNDYELTRQRQEHQKKFGIEKGFPIFMMTIWDCKTGNIDIELFFTQRGLEKAIEGIKYKEKLYKVDIKYIQDVQRVSYETI